MTVTNQQPSTASRRRALTEGRILVLAAIVLSALTLRVAVTAFTPLAERIGADIGYSTAIVGVFGMIPTAMFALAGLITPIFVRRLGLERTALVAMLLTGSGQLIRALVPDTWELLVLSAVALTGMGIGNVVIPPLVKRYFADHLAVLSSVYITMVQVGTMIPALVAVPLADAAGWRVSLGVWALIGFAAVVPWLGVLRDRRGRDRADVTAMAEVAGGEPERAGSIRRSPLAWGMAAMFGMTSLITYSMFTWLPKILADAGADDSFGGTMVGFFSFIGLAAALTAPSFTARIRNPFPVVIGCAVAFFVAFAGLLIAPMSAPWLWVLLLGLGPSTFPMALTLINLRTRTQAGSAALSGFTQGIGYTVACVGPLLFGVLHSAVGGWGVPFALLAVAVLVLLAGAWQACKPRMLEDTWH
ncbi:major facilitator superfamily transporter [Nocardia nova SH22a]|uniref:Major facilitator superfamily transporter n=1 Tax=Nocardia nova SH22a TaxID=1415166 RepID=W5TA44_9NOCA|nr:MFS transporter [Nocardia nova]AHH16215.1 major facilitator superfamily transporter [Nocardia nova SH22a]